MKIILDFNFRSLFSNSLDLRPSYFEFKVWDFCCQKATSLQVRIVTVMFIVGDARENCVSSWTTAGGAPPSPVLIQQQDARLPLSSISATDKVPRNT